VLLYIAMSIPAANPLKMPFFIGPMK
jgi:hypothetical protein